jgi:predicted phage terminase large subunit-like protein
LTFSATLTSLRQVIAKFPGRAILIEDKANGPAVISALRNDVPGIIAVDPKSSKMARLVAVSPEIEAGNVWLPDASLAAALRRKARGSTGVADMVEEVVAFPNAAHDDDVDAMTQALLRFKGSADGFFQYLQAEYQESLEAKRDRPGVDRPESEIAKQIEAERPDPCAPPADRRGRRMIRDIVTDKDSGLREQLETAAVRNATFIVLLRHTTARLHAAAIGHSRAISWISCPHEDCRRVSVMLGDRPTVRTPRLMGP